MKPGFPGQQNAKFDPKLRLKFLRKRVAVRQPSVYDVAKLRNTLEALSLGHKIRNGTYIGCVLFTCLNKSLW
jgi:hypothetical protein